MTDRAFTIQCLPANMVPGSSDVEPVNPVEEKTIVSIGKISARNGIDTYQITYSEETTSTLTMTAEKDNSNNNNALPIVAIVLSTVSIVRIGLSFFLQFRKHN